MSAARVFVWRGLMKNARVSLVLARRLLPPHPGPAAGSSDEDPWINADGDRTLRVEYDLDTDALVWDLGGYRGDWAAEISARFRCSVEVFEPVPQFAARIATRFERNPLVTVHTYGLAGSSRRAVIAVDDDASSIYNAQAELAQVDPNDARPVELFRIELRSGTDEIRSCARDIDLLKVNIEGVEYELLEALIESREIRRIRNLQVQFHKFVRDAEERRDSIRTKLRETHHLTYEFPWVWENWERSTA
jgi:FkbM family methyltransferase